MEVGMSAMVWSSIIVLLLCTSLGYYMATWLTIHVSMFLLSVLGMLYYQGWRRSIQWKKDHEICFSMPPPSIGLPKVVEEMRKEKRQEGIDKRMTGSNVIDEVLHEIMRYTFRDFVQTWHKKISDEPEFELAVRRTLQNVIIAFSERAKEVDLLPYLTVHLVDDFASHIRLYRRTLDTVALHQLDSTKPPPDLEKIFFGLECEMEKSICRDSICLDAKSETQYLQDITEVLLYLLLPADDFNNKSFRYIAREIIVNGVVQRCVNLFSDPDYINQLISWLTKNTMFTSEAFLTILKTSDSIDELMATKEKVDLDIARQRSKDTGGDDDAEIKQQLSSLKYVKSVCEASIDRLNSGASGTSELMNEPVLVAGQRLYQLPFDVILNNNIALEYFMEFMGSLGVKHYIYFYFTVEGYRVTAEQQISAALLTESEDGGDLEMLRDACTSIYHQYLSDKASPRVKCDDKLLKKIQYNIKYRSPSDTVFDEIQARVWNMMQEDPRYLPAFLKSQLYMRLLAELDLRADQTNQDETSRSNSPARGMREGSIDSSPAVSDTESLRAEVDDDNVSVRSMDLCTGCDVGSARDVTGARCVVIKTGDGKAMGKQEQVTKLEKGRGDFSLSAHITNTGICREHGKQYAVYLVTVNRRATPASAQKDETKWSVYRRYSDFHELHHIIQDKYKEIAAGLVLPSKKAFNNMTKALIERRKNGLNAYLQTVLTPGVLSCHRGLLDLMSSFLEPRGWAPGGKTPGKKTDTPTTGAAAGLRSVGQLVRNMPDTLADGVTKMSGGIRNLPNVLDGVGRILTNKPGISAGSSGVIEHLELPDSQKVGANLRTEDEDNIPLRIVLLLMDEVFDLRQRQQWLRRRVVAILRQFIKTMFGDSINRKIVEHVAKMTAAEQIAEHFRNFKDEMWPGGVLAEPRAARDLGTRMRTRVAARAKMLGTIDDELKSFLGSDTTRRGVTRVFSMFQQRALNKRLVYVILEGMLAELFPEHKFPDLFRKIHAASPTAQQQAREKSASKMRSAAMMKDAATAAATAKR